MSGSESSLDSKAAEVKKDGARVGESKDGVESKREKTNSIEQSHSTGKGSLSNESQTKNGDKKKEKPHDGSVQLSKEGGNEGVLESSKPGKESLQGEECDASNQCVDDVNKLVACLRVPGDGTCFIL